MSWVATAVAVASALGSAYQTNRVAKKQDNIAAQGIRSQAENQRKVNARLNTTLDATAKSSPDTAKKSASAAYLAAIQRQLGGANVNMATNSAIDDYTKDAGDASWQAQDYAGQVAGLLSRIDAGGLQRQQEGNLLGDFVMDTDKIGGDIEGDNFLTKLRMAGVRRNPYLDAAIGAAKGYSAAGGWGGGGGYAGKAGQQQYMAPPPSTAAGSSWANAYGRG